MLAGRVFEPGYLVQIVMVELVVERLKRAPDVGEIHDPPLARLQRAGHVNFDTKRVAVKAVALVPGRHMRQPMSSFNSEYLEYFHERNTPGDACEAPL